MSAFNPYRLLIVAGVLLGLAALAGLGFWCGMAAIDAMVTQAASRGAAEERAQWQASIAVSNEIVARQRNEDAMRAVRAEAQAAAEIARLTDNLKKMEAANAALPDGDACGLDRDRVRLLNGSR